MNSKDLLQLYNGQLQEFELAKKNGTYIHPYSIILVKGCKGL